MFLEYRACVGRVIVQTIVTTWCLGWLYGPQPVLVADAQHVFPTAVLWALSVVWMLLVRRRIVPPSEWLDAMGFAMNVLFIGIQTYLAFILLMSLNAFLPFITIAAVARYGQRAIFPVLLTTFVLMLLTAPAGYWLSRPAYFVYAVALIIVLPLLVARIVLAMQEVALQALASRDAQSRFISTMSHELRTPLNAVINCAQLIDTEQMPAQQRELLQAVTVSAYPTIRRPTSSVHPAQYRLQSRRRRRGFRLYIALSVSDAVQRIREAAPDLVFLDLHMPGTTGWDALREARDAMWALPPIIVLTADTRTDSMREASAAGVAGYLPKPINAHELLALLAQHASHARP